MAQYNLQLYKRSLLFSSSGLVHTQHSPQTHKISSSHTHTRAHTHTHSHHYQALHLLFTVSFIILFLYCMMVLNIFSLLLKIAIDIYTVIFGKWYICIYISLSGKNQIQHVCNICIALRKFEYSAGVADWRPFPTDGFQSVQDSSVRKEERVWVFFSYSTTAPQSLGEMTQSSGDSWSLADCLRGQSSTPP